jgi:hypothetical protein
MVEILEVGHVCFFYRPRVWPETVTQRSLHDRHPDFDLSDKAMRVLVENAIMAGVLAADCTRKVRPWLDSVGRAAADRAGLASGTCAPARQRGRAGAPGKRAGASGFGLWSRRMTGRLTMAKNIGEPLHLRRRLQDLHGWIVPLEFGQTRSQLEMDFWIGSGRARPTDARTP